MQVKQKLIGAVLQHNLEVFKATFMKENSSLTTETARLTADIHRQCRMQEIFASQNEQKIQEVEAA